MESVQIREALFFDVVVIFSFYHPSWLNVAMQMQSWCNDSFDDKVLLCDVVALLIMSDIDSEMFA